MSKFFELLSVIAVWACSRSCPREYHEALEGLGREEWPELKSSLTGPDAGHTLTLLQAFLEAYRAQERAKQDYIRGSFAGLDGLDEDWTEAYEIMLQKYNALRAAINM